MTTINEAKNMARRLRSALAARGHSVSHSDALELVANQLGCRDWNAANAALRRHNAGGDDANLPRNQIVEGLREARVQALSYYAQNPHPDASEFISRIDAKIAEWDGSSKTETYDRCGRHYLIVFH